MIGTCTKCHRLYDFGSQEAAYEPDRLCRECYQASRNDGAIVQHSKSGGNAFLHYRGLGTFQVPANVQADLNAASEEQLFGTVEASGFVDPFVLAEICNRGLYAAYQVWKAEQRNEGAKAWLRGSDSSTIVGRVTAGKGQRTMTVKIEGYLTLEPCRDLAKATKGQLAIERHWVNAQLRESVVSIVSIWQNGVIKTSNDRRFRPNHMGEYESRVMFENHSLRPFKEGETVESFLAAIQAKEAEQAAELQAKNDAKEAEHKRRLALLGGDRLWDNREEEVYCNPGSEDKLWIVVLIWNDAAGRLHVTHCHIAKPETDWNGKTVHNIKIWDVFSGNGVGNGAASSAQGEDPRDAIERWITREWA